MTKLKIKFLEDYDFSTLRDVNLTSLTEEDVIVFDSVSQKFKNVAVPKFGKDLDDNQNTAELSTTGGGTVTHQSNLKNLTIGAKYLLIARFEMQMSTVLKGIEVDLDVGGVLIDQTLRNDLPTNKWISQTLAGSFTATTISENIEINFRRDGNKNVSLRNSKVFSWRIS